MYNPLQQCISKPLDYDPFGMLLVGRNWEGGSEYRFGFNTQEQDNEVCGNGNLNSALYWEYDTRLGRRWNVDPLGGAYESPYSSFENDPIYFTDFKGDTEDGPGGRRAKYRAEKEIKKLEKQGHAAWISDKVDNDGVWNIEYATQKNYVEEYGTGGIVINTKNIKLNVFNKIYNGLGSADEWAHSDKGEQFGQEVAGFNPAIELMNIGHGALTGENIFNEEMTAADYSIAAISFIPIGKIGTISGKIVNRGLIKFTTKAGDEVAYQIWHKGGEDISSYLAKKKWTSEEIVNVIEHNNWVIHKSPSANNITGKGMKRYINPDINGKDLIMDDDGVIIQLGEKGYSW